MEENLKKISNDYNTTSDGLSQKSGGGDIFSNNDLGPIAQIVSILNRHHESLAWLDERSR